MLDRIGESFYRTSRSVAAAVGFERSAWGRKLLGRCNILGEKFSRWLLLRGRSFKVDGHKLLLSGRSGPSISFSAELLSGRYEQETAKMFKETLGPGMNVLDVGAHVGYHSLLAARLIGPTGKVYAFEASPDNFELLEKNIELNRYKNIMAIPKAVSDRTGTITFHLSPEGNDRNSIYESSRTASSGGELEVSTVSLDDFLEQQGWPEIHLVKIDVEGAEPLVLRGMSKLLERSTELKMVVEFAPSCIREGGCAPQQFLEGLANRGLRIHVLQGERPAAALNSSDFASFLNQVEGEGMRNLVCYR